MKKIHYILFLSFLSISCKGTSQVTTATFCRSFYSIELKQTIYTFVDVMPEYPGGDTELVRFILINLKTEQNFPQHKVFCSFVINQDGMPTDIKITKKEKKDYTQIENEVIRILNLMQKWEPGKCADTIVPVQVFFPLTIEYSE